jgi:hypothetical protein
MNSAQWAWRKSSRSATSGQCVEVVWVWRKSSQSVGNGDCVEVAWPNEAVALRDSKNPDGGYLTVSPAAHAAFLATLRTFL